ncbi:FAD-binding protein (plasmid) [Sinorhizobium meliloti]|nr:FAD-binding protein [Sinorhizobium meliloti]
MKYDVVVIGAGPPGMSAAIRLRKNGSSVCGDRRATRTGRPDLARR